MQQNTDEWLQMRLEKIGASDAPIIMGDSPWKTPYQLWQLKTGRVQYETTNKRQQRGHDLEPLALETYNKETSSNARPRVVFSSEYSWMIASLDGFDEQKNIPVEIKCPGDKDHHIASQDRVPDKYWAQVQHQLAVTGCELLHYYSFSEQSTYLVSVHRDNDYIAEMIKRESAFYSLVQSDIAPELTDRDYVQRRDFEFSLAEHDYIEAYTELQRAKNNEARCRKKLIDLCDGQSSAGLSVSVRRSVRHGHVDYTQIPELQGIDLAQYRKPEIETWRVFTK